MRSAEAEQEMSDLIVEPERREQIESMGNRIKQPSVEHDPAVCPEERVVCAPTCIPADQCLPIPGLNGFVRCDAVVREDEERGAAERIRTGGRSYRGTRATEVF